MITLAGTEVTTAGGTGVECLTEIAGARTTVTISFAGVGATNGRPYIAAFSSVVRSSFLLPEAHRLISAVR